MKFIFTLSLFTLFSLTINAQHWQLEGGYSLGLMQKEMKENIPPAHSLKIGGAYQLPGKWNRVAIGAELGVGVYASKTIDQTFNFGSSSSVVPVNYSSNVFTGNINLRYDFADNQEMLIPYISAKTGVYRFYSNIYVEDPRDVLGCRALQQENIISDNTLYWSAGGGLKVNSGFFGKYKHRSNVLIDLGAHFTRGGTMDYINTTRLMEVQNSTPQSKPVNVTFVNANTQEIHEHTVAQVYSSPLRMLEIKAGVVFLLGR